MLLITSLFACVLSLHNVIARYKFALADRAYMPARFGTVHPKHHSPAFASVVQSITAALLTCVFAALHMDPLTEVFAMLAGIATAGIVIIMALTSIGIWFFFRRSQHVADKAWQQRIAPAFSVVALLISLWLVLSNFPLVTGGTLEVSTVLAIIPFAVLLAGFILGLKFPSPRPTKTSLHGISDS